MVVYYIYGCFRMVQMSIGIHIGIQAYTLKIHTVTLFPRRQTYIQFPMIPGEAPLSARKDT